MIGCSKVEEGGPALMDSDHCSQHAASVDSRAADSSFESLASRVGPCRSRIEESLAMVLIAEVRIASQDARAVALVGSENVAAMRKSLSVMNCSLLLLMCNWTRSCKT